MFKILKSLTFLKKHWFRSAKFTPDRIRDLEHKKIFKQKLLEINNLSSGQKANKLRELIDVSSTVKGYGPVMRLLENSQNKYMEWKLRKHDFSEIYLNSLIEDLLLLQKLNKKIGI